MICGAIRPMKLMQPTKATETEASSAHTAMLAGTRKRTGTPRLFAV